MFLVTDFFSILVHLQKISVLNFKTVVIILVSCFCLYFVYQGFKFISMIIIVAKITESDVEGNVPSKVDFDRFLERDLENYFKPKYGDEIKVKYSLFREGPTQTGIAYPKYYLWVSINKEKN